MPPRAITLADPCVNMSLPLLQSLYITWSAAMARKLRQYVVPFCFIDIWWTQMPHWYKAHWSSCRRKCHYSHTSHFLQPLVWDAELVQWQNWAFQTHGRSLTQYKCMYVSVLVCIDMSLHLFSIVLCITQQSYLD